MDKHEVGDILLTYTSYGAVMIGIITNIQYSQIDIYSDLYSVTWFGKIVEEISNSYYTHSNISRMKKNLIEYFEDNKN